MNFPLLSLGCSFLVLLHVLIWFSSNGQFMEDSDFFKKHSLAFAICVSPFVAILGYYGSRFIHEAMSQSLWQIRFIGFGLSYLVFPILTWYLLGESMFTLKTMLCIALSILMIMIQIYM